MVLLVQVLFALVAWFDMLLEGKLDAAAMQDGVRTARTFILLLTEPYPSSWFCLLEYVTALMCQPPKDMALVLETDRARDAVPDVAKAFDAIAEALNFNAGLADVHKAEKGGGSFRASFPTIARTELWPRRTRTNRCSRRASRCLCEACSSARPASGSSFTRCRSWRCCRTSPFASPSGSSSRRCPTSPSASWP